MVGLPLGEPEDDRKVTAQQAAAATYVEIVTDTYAAPPLAEHLGANTETLYSA
jgi:indolepyruvate decarboxylase